MPTAYTSLLGLALPVTGELSGTWGDTVNNSITSLLDTAVAGTTTLSTDADVTLTTTTGASNQARQAILLCNGARTGTKNITAPATSKTYVVINSTTGGFGVVIRGAGPTTGVTIANGERAVVAWNGSDFVKISGFGGTLTVTDLTVTGNTILGDAAGDTITVNGATTFTNAAPILTPLTASRAVFTDGSKALVSNAITGTGNVVMSASPTLTGTVGAASLTLSSLTSGRVTYAGASGLLQDSANLTFDGTSLTLGGNPTLSAGTANAVLYLNGSKVATSGSALTFDGTVLRVNGSATSALRLTSSAPTSNGFNLYNDSGTDTAYLMNYFNGPMVFGVNNAEQMRLTSTGLGIGTSSPQYKLHVAQSSSAVVFGQDSTTANIIGTNAAGTASQGLFLKGFPLTFTGNGGGGAEHMRLDSSGNLGIGTTSPGYKLGISGVATTYAASASIALYDTISGVPASRNWLIGNVAAGNYGELNFAVSSAAGGVPTNSKMTLDASGNLGLGVTPSAWGTYKAMQVGQIGAFWANPSGADVYLSANYYFGAAADRYIATGAATYYKQNAGAHIWGTAPSGTAGNTISFTQAMTLDASGRLGIGTTNPQYRLDVEISGGPYNARFVNSSSSTSEYNVTLWGQNAAGSAGGYIGTGGSTVGNASFQNTFVVGTQTSHALVFNTNDTERARITSGGDLLVGSATLTNIAGRAQRLHVTQPGSGVWAGGFVNTATAGNNPYGVSVFYSGSSPNGTANAFFWAEDNAALRAEIRSNGGIANYQANDVNLSDRREKTNFAPAKDYLDTICAIPVQTFNYIDQSPDDPGLTLGVVAQDVQAVAPELVHESNWGTEDNPKMRLSVYQTDLQYALMKAIQELAARVAQLERQA